MKRPVCLIGTSFSIFSGLAFPLAPTATADGDVQGAAARTVVGSTDEEHPSHFIVPVPPAVDDGHDGWPGNSLRSLRRPPLTTTHSRAANFTHVHALLPSSLLDPPPRRLYHATAGTFRNLVLLLRFSDHASRAMPSQTKISRLYNSEDRTIPTDEFLDRGGGGDDVNPTGSVRQVYLHNSHGTFTVETTVIDWITLSQPESYYAAGNHGFSKFKEAIVEALDVLDDDPEQYFQPLGLGSRYEGFDFGEFDVDENGALDGLGVLHSGYGAEFGGTDCDGALNEERIWSHKGGLDWNSNRASAEKEDDVRVNRYYVSSALRGKCHADIVRMGVICHELGHYLGLPDLYDGTFKGNGVGAFDFMSQSWGWDGSGMYPPNLSAWSKLKVGWATAELIEEDGTYELEASTSSSVVYKIARGYPSGEYILLENRQPLGYDSKIAQGGIAIYHVDEKTSGQRNLGHPWQSGKPGFPKNGKHYKVALLAADGNYDLEQAVNQGDAGDLWHAESVLSELGPSEVFPNTDTYQNGYVQSVGIRIYGFSSSRRIMTFSVEGLGSMEKNDDVEVMGKVVSLEEIFSSPKTTEEPTPQPTSDPTLQPTPGPVVVSPTSLPTSKPVMLAPTPKPSFPPTIEPTDQPSYFTSQPSRHLATAPPTSSPITLEETTCANLCVVPVSSEECPSRPHKLPNCLNVPIDAMCDADGECDTDSYLNNCSRYDVYQRVDCATVVTAATAVETVTTTTAVTTTVTMTKISASGDNIEATKDVESFAAADPAVGSMPHAHHAALDGMPNAVLIQPEEDEPIITLTTRSPSRLPSPAPTTAPSSFLSIKPSVLVILGSSSLQSQMKPLLNSVEDTERSTDVSHAEDNDCVYYPGWNLGLSHCLKDCLQPNYMHSNPIFEFDTLEGCCDLHYQGKDSCRAQTLLAMAEPVGNEDGWGAPSSGSVAGQVWRDANGNHWQDAVERSMGFGVPGVAVGLYECPSGVEPVTGALTSLDGSYLLQGIQPGRYYTRVTPLEGYHLSNDISGSDDEFDSDFDGEGRSPCLDFAITGGTEFILNAGLIPDSSSSEDGSLQTQTDLVSAAETDETEVKGGFQASADFGTSHDGDDKDDGEEENVHQDKEEKVGNDLASYSVTHAKSRTSDKERNSGNSAQLNVTPDDTMPLPVLHSKSFLRAPSSSYLNTGADPPPAFSAIVTIAPADEATIHSNEGIKFVGGVGELRVGPQSSWQNDVLLKFDMTPSALTEQRDYRAASRALLCMYALTSSPFGGAVSFAPSNEWDGEDVTWTTAPEVGHVLANIGQTRPHSWVEADVTGMLLAKDGVATLRIVGETSNHSWLARYGSRENEEGHPAPELRVYF